jgi:biotin carboxylase
MEKILVIGFRRGLIEALQSLNIPFVIWHEERFPSKYQTPGSLLQQIPLSREKIKTIVEQFIESGPYSHVIAGTEAAVVAASIARRVLNCRQSQHSTVIKCHDKSAMKEYLAKYDIPMTKFILHDKNVSAEHITGTLGFPVVVKERQQSGGRGTVFLNDHFELAKAMSSKHLYEQYIEGDEVSVETFINHGEILFSNITQYFEKSHINLVPPHLTDNYQHELLTLNKKIIQALKIQWGITHAEFYLTAQGIYFGEIAVRPPGGYIMELMSKAYEFNAWEAFVAMELDRSFQFPARSVNWAAVNILHPGEGVVKNIDGVDAIKQLASFDNIKLKISTGDAITARKGVSNEVGHYVLVNQDKAVLLKDLKVAKAIFNIEIKN